MTAMMIKKSLLSCLVFVCMLHGAPRPACALHADEDLQQMSWVERAAKIATGDITKVVQRADAGDTDSQMILAYALTGDSPLPENPEKALKYALMAAEKGNPFAQAMLMYIANKYPTATISKEYAFKMALESSKQGNSIGASNAGTAYLFGIGVGQNLESAFALLAEAHKAGHPEAAARLCLLQSVSEEKQNGSLLLKLVEHQTVFNYECGPKLTSDDGAAPEKAGSAIASPAVSKAVEPPVAVNASQTDEKQVSEQKVGQEHAAALKLEESRKAAAARAEQEKRDEAEARRQAVVKAEAERAAAAETARLAALKAEEERKAAQMAEQERSARAKAEQVIPVATKTPAEVANNHNDRVATSPAKKYFRHVDRNGVVSWLDEQSKIPPPAPVYHKYEDSNGLVFWVDDVSKIPAEYRNSSMQAGDGSAKVGKSPDQTVRPGAKAVQKKSRRAPARLGTIKPGKRSKR